MCRLFGMLSIEPSNASKYLLEDPCSLYNQSKANPLARQGDGWGIGYYSGRVCHLVKSEKPVYEEYEDFASAVGKADSNLILAHVRRASNPRGLPRTKIISIENSQPFKHENYLFVHNGTITIPDEVEESLGDWRSRIAGFNDSEVYFWFIVKAMTEGASFADAVRQFEGTLSELWEMNREKHPDKLHPYIGLNALLSDGERLYAYCKHDRDDESRKSLCFKEQPVFQMSYLVSPERLIVSSEKTNKDEDWKPLKSGHILIGEIDGKRVTIRLQGI